MDTSKKEFIISLAEAGAIKFGRFKLKSGLISPFYIDLRDIVSFPQIMTQLKELIIEHLKGKKFDLVSGIPYTALPVASLVSVDLNKPLIYMRKEKKDYGTEKNIEGRFKEGEKCLVIDDVMTTGESKLETALAFEKSGIDIAEFLVVIDRSDGGEDFVRKKGFEISSIFSLEEVLNILVKSRYISQEQSDQAIQFVKQKQPAKRLPGINLLKQNSKNLNTLALLDTAERKKSNLIASIDVTSEEEFFRILNRVAPHIAMVKTHIDIIRDYSFVFIERLRELSEKHDFMIFEDRKFADIGNTVKKQFQDGVYKISSWTDFITVHGLPGPGILEGLFGGAESGGAFLLAKMSAKGNLLSQSYTNQIIDMGAKFPHWVPGFIVFAENSEELKKLRNKIPEGMLLLMPGVSLDKKSDDLGQQYVSVDEAVSGGADFVIVGRGIYGADEPGESAAEYRRIAWEALQKR